MSSGTAKLCCKKAFFSYSLLQLMEFGERGHRIKRAQSRVVQVHKHGTGTATPLIRHMVVCSVPAMATRPFLVHVIVAPEVSV